MDFVSERQHQNLKKALEEKDLGQVEALLRAGVDPNVYDNRNRLERPLVVATRANFLPGLVALHRAGAYINASQVDANQVDIRSPLMIAAQNGFVEVGRWLLRQGADVSLKCLSNDTALSFALTHRHIEFAEMVLQEQPHCRQDQLVHGAKRAIGSLTLPAAQWLLKQGITPNLVNEYGCSWLRSAQSANHALTQSMTDLLLRAGADVNLLDNGGSTPLHQAFEQKKPDALLRLLQSGADPELPNKNGRSVQSLVAELPIDAEMRQVFEAWENCKAAQKAIAAVTPTGLQPL